MPITDEQYRITSGERVTLSFESSPGERRLRHRIGLAREHIPRCISIDSQTTDSDITSHRGKDLSVL